MSKSEIVRGSVIGAVARCHSPSLPKLIALCAVLQRMNGIEPFALDGRAVADVLHVSKSVVYRNIEHLIEAGILDASRTAIAANIARQSLFISLDSSAPTLHPHPPPTRPQPRSGSTIVQVPAVTGRSGWPCGGATESASLTTAGAFFTSN